MKDNVISFLSGAALTITWSWQAIIGMFGDFGIKMITALAVGIVGGMGGLIGKEIVGPWIKQKFKRKWQKRK